MIVKKLWQLPVTSSELVDGGVKLFLQENIANIMFEYYDENNNVSKSGILFEAVEAQKCTSEMFTEYLSGTFDCLVEIDDSKWVKQLRKLNQEIVDYWQLKHYAIFIKSYGFFEFAARNYRIIEG